MNAHALIASGERGVTGGDDGCMGWGRHQRSGRGNRGSGQEQQQQEQQQQYLQREYEQYQQQQQYDQQQYQQYQQQYEQQQYLKQQHQEYQQKQYQQHSRSRMFEASLSTVLLVPVRQLHLCQSMIGMYGYVIAVLAVT